MALDVAIVYATYEDDGSAHGTTGQLLEYTEPKKQLLIFPNMALAKEYDLALRTWSNGRKNPRITAFYSCDADEILMGCNRATIIEPKH